MTLSSSDPGAPWGEVTVETIEEGVIRVSASGADPAPDHLGSAVDVSGATVVVDMRHGDRPPTGYVFDAFWAQTWMADVYGPEVVERVKDLARDPDAPPVGATATYGSLSDVFVRLGVATWLHRWWPSGNPDLNVPFSVELLELEIGALRWLAEAAFVERSAIDRVLRPRVGVLHSFYDWNHFRNDDDLRQRLIDEVLTTALRAVVDTVPESTPGYAECAELLDAVDAGAQLGHDDWRSFAELKEAAQLAIAGTMRGGKGGEARPEPGWFEGEPQYATADLRDIPPRWLADVDDNVSWVIETSGADSRIAVTAEAAPHLLTPPVGGHLMVRAYVDGEPVVFALEWSGPRPEDAAGAVFRGTAPLPAGTNSGAATIEVGVFHPSWAGAARLSSASLEQAERERAEITRLLTDRYARFPERLNSVERGADPFGRPTVAEIVARMDP